MFTPIKASAPLIIKDLHFEPLSETHFPLLEKWLASPHVKGTWDSANSLVEVKKKYGDKIESLHQCAYIVFKEGAAFAYIQSYQASKAGAGWWEEEPQTTAGIDLFIGDESFLGQGLGAEVAKRFSDWLLSFPHIKKVIADPKPNNERAIHCYEKAGFKRIKEVETPDGKALLMEKRASKIDQ